jgi:hypothetical protein
MLPNLNSRLKYGSNISCVALVEDLIAAHHQLWLSWVDASRIQLNRRGLLSLQAFDYLLLLQRGGRTTYFGPLGHHSSALVAYLQAVPGRV